MPTVYLKMGLPNFLNIYIRDKVMGFIKTFFIERCSFVYSDHIYRPSYSCLSFY